MTPVLKSKTPSVSIKCPRRHVTPEGRPEAASNPGVLAGHGVRVVAEMPHLAPVSIEGAAEVHGRALAGDVLLGG